MNNAQGKRSTGRNTAGRAHEGTVAVAGIREDQIASQKDALAVKDIPTVRSGFSTFAVFDSNIEAFQMSQLFANGLVDFACLIGPSGWGKTHLVQAAAQQMRRSAPSRKVAAQSAVDWLSSPSLPNPHLPVLLDDVQEVLQRTRCRLRFQLALERRVKARRPTFLVFTSGSEAAWAKKILPDKREWLLSHIAAPSLEERKLVMSRMEATLRLRLDPGLADLLASRLGGSGGSMMGALKRLKLEGSTWLGNLGSVRACGVLNPFLVSDSGWDLRDAISDASQALVRTSAQSTPADSLAIYGMLRLAKLSEVDVARYSGLSQARAYHRALDVEANLIAGGERQQVDEALAEATLRAVR